MPQINEFYAKNRDSGLHIINILAQKTDSEVWKKFNNDKGVEFPATYFEGNKFDNYPIGKRLPHHYIIGADGKVAWEGGAATGLAWTKQAAKALKDVKYPFIGMRDVPKQLDKAAQFLSDGLFGKAYIEAVKIAEKAEKSENEAVVEYAEKMTDSIEERVDGKFERVRILKSLRHYHTAVELLEYLAGDACKGMDAQQDAKDELKEIKEDDDAQMELKAWKALAKIIKKTEKSKSNSDSKKALAKFFDKNKGTAAADEAKNFADKLK